LIYILIVKELKQLSESKTRKGCACTQGLQDLLRAYSPKKDPLRNVVCAGCGKVFWTNFDREYCFDCEAEKKR
jgi:hypothetical protein